MFNYRDYLQSDYWKRFRLVAYEVFEYKCHFCDSSINLNVHHTRYYKTTLRTGNERNNFRWFLVVCSSCHTRIHSLQKDKNLEVYLATKTFRNMYFPKKKMWKNHKRWNKIYKLHNFV